MRANRYLAAAESVAQAIPGILAEQGLEPLIKRYILTETDQGDAWLFVVMDNRVLDSLECYTAPAVIIHISAALRGHPVLSSSDGGLRYAILLSSYKNMKWASPCSPTVHAQVNL